MDNKEKTAIEVLICLLLIGCFYFLNWISTDNCLLIAIGWWQIFNWVLTAAKYATSDIDEKNGE